MTSADQTLCRKLLSYRIENESDKPLIAFCIRKIGTVETIEIVFNFDQTHWFDFLTVRSSPEDFLEEHISSTDCYFVPSFDIEPANLWQWKFDSLVEILLKKKHEYRL